MKKPCVTFKVTQSYTNFIYLKLIFANPQYYNSTILKNFTLPRKTNFRYEKKINLIFQCFVYTGKFSKGKNPFFKIN